MWPDIDGVTLFDTMPERLSALRRTKQRLNASRYFALAPFAGEHAKPDTDTRRHIGSYLAWASIAALSSARDMLVCDLQEDGRDEEWKCSIAKKRLDQDPLLAVLHELRNYEVHLECREGEIRDHEAYAVSADGLTLHHFRERNAFFIVPIVYDELASLRNIASGRSTVTPEMVEWFKRQASDWPAVYIVGKAHRLFALYVDDFLAGADLGTVSL